MLNKIKVLTPVLHAAYYSSKINIYFSEYYFYSTKVHRIGIAFVKLPSCSVTFKVWHFHMENVVL